MKLLALLAVISLALGCRRDWPGEPAPLIIRDRDHYMAVWKEVQAETERPLMLFEENRPLSGDDQTLLEQAHPKVLGLIKDKPQSFPPRVIYAKLLRACNAPDRALAAYLEALAVVPDSPPAEYVEIMAECRADIAEIYFGRKELEKAQEELKEALRLRPNTVRFMLDLIQVQLDAGLKEEARRQLESARRLSPNHPGVKSLSLLFDSPSGAEPSSSPKGAGTR